jgi:hypothetical protein
MFVFLIYIKSIFKLHIFIVYLAKPKIYINMGRKTLQVKGYTPEQIRSLFNSEEKYNRGK